jgi:hypothetical protein
MSFDEAHERLLEAMRASRRRTLAAEPAPSLHQAREALASVWPLLPSMIDAVVGESDARIFSRDDLRKFLANFAVDMLIAQADAVERWIDAEARQRNKGA